MSPSCLGYDFWRNKLGSARYIVAPMVEQSELAWRLLSRRHGAQLCYTPMLHASMFIKDLKYRRESLQSCPEDRPLIFQFCANNPDTLVEAAKLIVGHCEGVDLNLGCPQAIAKRGHYGAFLQDEWELIHNLVSRVHQEVALPITCKIRVFPDVERTVRYAQMLESAGCQILTVHGRTREQRGPLTGIASWEHIKAVKEAVNVPVFANGNIQFLSDIDRCFKETGVDGIMTAEGNLHNPALFEGKSPPVWEMAEEYLDIVKKYPCSLSSVRAHVFKLFHHCLTISENQDLRSILATASSLDVFSSVCSSLRKRYEGDVSHIILDEEHASLPHLPWLCQPYVRPKPKQPPPVVELAATDDQQQQRKRSGGEDLEEQQVPTQTMSKKKLKKMQRNESKPSKGIRKLLPSCLLCANPRGTRCVFQMCKGCCRNKASQTKQNCPGHKFVCAVGRLSETILENVSCVS